MQITDTIAAISTGMNNAGIGIIRISGVRSFEIASRIFRTVSGKQIKEFESHKVYYGYITDKEIIDEVLLIALRSPRSYTAEDTIEIDCHGGNTVMRRILRTVIDNGARPAEPGEFTKRAFLNGRIDLSEAEAVIDIINSKNTYSLDNSMKQLTGKLHDKITDIRNRIKYEIAHIEAALDDPEHYDLNGYYDELSVKTDRIIDEITHMRKSFKEGKILSEGINTVILGKPNVGKSSLLNILTGEESAIVTEIAGTTRDVLEQDIIINGLTLKLMDTAGIRETEDTVEKIGVQRAYKYADEADLIIMLIDSSVPVDENDIALFDYIKDKNSVILLNKSDLPVMIAKDDVKKHTDKPVMSISAKEEEGIEEFKTFIEKMFTDGMIDYNDEVIITNERHLILIDEAINSLNEVMTGIASGMPEDLISIDLTNAYYSLGAITGEKVGEDIINEIFSKFCMGK
ncbi:MAG: tRNA uridine-5-carboxymethylaminomethyl(34) synthesis GTPase MnmE [Lachnospiraceae bacterium]|nr:tRNA uridine-5-carboxymethylaminomethyl(34) synthesis GTPase MnmE [Lachnospiraceae bacterium]